MEDILVGVNINKRGINEVISDLEKLGFETKEILQHIHFVFGSINPKNIPQAKTIKGIYSIVLNKVSGIKDEE